MIAALYIDERKGGSYLNIPGVDPWGESRDARLYKGPHPVVCHPPCQRWSKMWAGQPLWIKRTGERKIKGDDGGCFAAALDAVRRYGGVLEHPWGSHAWSHFGLNVPPREGGWVSADFHGGWTCCVEQGQYGHYARKPTLLYAVGCDLPELRWGKTEPQFPAWAIEKYGLAKCKRAGELAFKGGGTDSSPRIGTPRPFRDLLLDMARSAPMPTKEPTMMQNDIERIAKGLTLAQREALRTARYWAGYGAYNPPGEYLHADRRVRLALMKRGILRDYLSPSQRLTPLGLQVRDYLQSQGTTS